MKTKALILCIVAVFALAACHPKPELSVSQSNIEVPTDGSTVSLTVSANYGWTATTGGASWISMSQSGTDKGGETTVTLKISANSTADDRTADITFSCEDEMKTVHVHQAQKDMVVLKDGDNPSVSWEEQQFEMKLSTNVDYTVISDAEWLKVLGTKALVPGTVTFYAEENDSFDPREAHLRFEKQGVLVKEIVLTQNGRPQVITVVHTNSVMKAPVVFGFGMTATIDWGDGQKGAYNSSVSHSYVKAGTYEIRIEANQASTASISDLVGVEKVDLSEF